MGKKSVDLFVYNLYISLECIFVFFVPCKLFQIYIQFST